MSKLRFGVVGCGGISNLHARCLRELESEGLCQLVAGAEINQGRRESWGKQWSVPVHESLDELLSRSDLDAVVVTSPSGLHGEMAVQIAESGRHVLSEKPLDVRLDKVDAAIAAARKNKVFLGGIFQQRFTPGAQKVKRAIDEGYFGEIVLAHCETPWYRTQEYYDSDAWRGTWALDGGVLFNQAPHMIDRLIWFAGDVEAVTGAQLRCGYHRDIEAETVAVAMLRFESGALGSVTGTTLAFDGLQQRVLICGTKGSAAFANDDLIEFKTEKPFHFDDEPVSLVDSAKDGKAANPLSLSNVGHTANIRDFIIAVRDQRPPAVTGEDQRKVVRAINLIYEAAKVGPFAEKRSQPRENLLQMSK